MGDSRILFPEKLQELFRPHRYKVVVGGRGKGGSWGIARALLLQGWENPLRILCTREVQRTIADSVHRLLSDQIALLGLSSFYKVTDNEITAPNGTLFSFAGLRQLDAGKIKSFEGYDRAWIEEAENISKHSWEILIPTIRRPASEVWVNLNPQLDTDETYRRFVVQTPPDTALIMMTWRDNPFFPEVLEKERLYLQKTDPESYENVWEGKPTSSVPGAIYRHEVASLLNDKRVRPVPYDPMLRVHTSWDFGWADATSVILVQRLRSELRVIGYMEGNGRVLSEYVSDLERLKYRWGTDYVPHDALQKDFKSGTSAMEILQGMGRSPMMVPNVGLEQGIKVARLVFPRVYIDEDKCQRLVECLRRYRRAIPTNTGEPASPLHDEYSHGADAFRYMALSADQMGNEAQVKIEYKDLDRAVV